jgi:hypothetical protein
VESRSLLVIHQLRWFCHPDMGGRVQLGPDCSCDP